MTDFNDIRERVIWVVNHSVGTAHKYPYLEERTGISARKWKNLCNRVQQPSIEMIAALAREFRPKYLEWMVMGEVISSAQVDPSEEEHFGGSFAHPELLGKERQALAAASPAEIAEAENAFNAIFARPPARKTRRGTQKD